ncbi:MAG: ubiquinol-cytochrome C chaperone family protein [Alphaproteobacteria bacterium]|nr:hypothetical protein [Rhodospirillaceae bacterium]MDG2482748.1 ubiquinol-cytochrome C chaperone family protein [Alphaproteobacteria bacterium]MBT6203094.1 hypothetical protein [Rhodospirillaceae bacterium]MBT6510487.1 hypothetical protein [Rhodospirillaceae bacterium]MBT7615133.1 hypothetical protein [Rhodospirillaceae bacterium]
MLQNLFSRSRFDESTHLLYDMLVAQAREPSFYTDRKVPDTLDGRFEMVVLHALLVMRQLRGLGDSGEEAAQKLFDLMFADFDRALRELGVGDLSVGRRMKKMAQAFYGRAAAFDEALAEAPAGEALARFLERNTYGTVEVDGDTLTSLEHYVRIQDDYLAKQAPEALLKGIIEFSTTALRND